MTVDYLTFNTKMNWLNGGAVILKEAIFFGSFGFRNVRSNRTFFRDFQRFLKITLDKDL
jgi:hypothetical protein